MSFATLILSGEITEAQLLTLAKTMAENELRVATRGDDHWFASDESDCDYPTDDLARGSEELVDWYRAQIMGHLAAGEQPAFAVPSDEEEDQSGIEFAPVEDLAYEFGLTVASYSPMAKNEYGDVCLGCLTVARSKTDYTTLLLDAENTPLLRADHNTMADPDAFIADAARRLAVLDELPPFTLRPTLTEE